MLAGLLPHDSDDGKRADDDGGITELSPIDDTVLDLSASSVKYISVSDFAFQSIKKIVSKTLSVAKNLCGEVPWSSGSMLVL